MIIFQNPGLIDIRAITTIGVNVKPDGHPIGRFGTGVKNAIAILLRTGHAITIYAGPDTAYAFNQKPTTIRGRYFNLVTMTTMQGPGDDGETIDLGFTTELGAYWEPWMAYRELWSNTMDEGGQVYHADIDQMAADIEPNQTAIVVHGPLIDQIHLDRAAFLLEEKTVLWANKNLEICALRGPAQAIFYRGIKVNKWHTAGAYTYNILKNDMPLTEDRTIDTFYLQSTVVKELLECDDKTILATVLSDGLEYGFDWYWSGHPPSDTLRDIALERIKKHEAVPSTLRDTLRERAPEDLHKAEQAIPDRIDEMLNYGPPFDFLSAEETLREALRKLYTVQSALKDAIAAADYYKACLTKVGETHVPRPAPLTGAPDDDDELSTSDA